MRRHKPDLLFVLTLLLGLGMLITTYGSSLLDGLDVQAHASAKNEPKPFQNYAKNKKSPYFRD